MFFSSSTHRGLLRFAISMAMNVARATRRDLQAAGIETEHLDLAIKGLEDARKAT